MASGDILDKLGGKLDLTEVQGELYRRDLRKYMKEMWHIIEAKQFTSSYHLDAICDHLAYVSMGDIKRLIINIPPRMTKSISCGVAFPTWEWANDGGTQFLCASYERGLAERDGWKAKTVIESPWYQEHMINTLPNQDRWYLNPEMQKREYYTNSKGGHRISISTGGKTTGEGGDILLFDDPHNARDVYSDIKRQNVIDWYDNAARSRVNNQNTGRIVLIGQRTHDDDLFGYLLKKESTVEHGGVWTHLNMPNEYNPRKRCVTILPPPMGWNITTGELEKTKETKEETADRIDHPIFEDQRTHEGDLLCPPRLGTLLTAELKGGMAVRDYEGQYNQNPSTDEGLIIKRAWWKPWAYPEWHDKAGKRMPLPSCSMIIQVYDTAFEEKEEADYSARSTWGIFEHEPETLDPRTGAIRRGKVRQCAILLEAWQDKISFPKLREEAIESYKDYDPDFVAIEKKASGHSLIQELRKGGMPVRGIPVFVDKVARAHIAVLPLEQGNIYYPPSKWAEDVIDACAKFPMAKDKDMVDTCTMAWMILRKLNEVGIGDDVEEDGTWNVFNRTPKRKRLYG